LLGDRRIATSNKEKTMAAVAQMWQSGMFTEDQMVVWENRGTMAQTWAALQTYFTEKWLERKQYSATTAKQLQFKEAALLTQETAAAKEEGNVVPTEITYMDMKDIQIRYIVFGNHQNTYIQFTYIVFGDHQNTYIQIHF
jgi:hypothetical protein